MAKKELDLFEFASCAMAEPGTGTTKIMRCKMVNAAPVRWSRGTTCVYIRKDDGEMRRYHAGQPSAWQGTHRTPESSSPSQEFTRSTYFSLALLV